MSDQFNEQTDGGLGGREGSPPAMEDELLTELPPDASFRPASPQERFAAFLADLLFFFYLLGGWGMLLQHLTHGDLAAPFSFKESGRILFASTGAALYFLYYLFFEGVFTATPGKFLCGLSVQRKKGGSPSLFALMIRNLCRIIDYPLVLFTGVGLMEATKGHQRLGDLLSGTMVTREVSFESRRINIETASLSGATRRTLANLLDLTLLMTFFYGLLLAIPTGQEIVSMVLLNGAPALALFYLALSETLFQTTFGKALFGMKVVQEDGRPAKLSILLVRNIFRLVDTNPVGYLCAFLSSRKQRPGDIAAGTLVVNDRKGFRGWLAIPFMLALSLGAAYWGHRNPDSFIKKRLDVKVGNVFISPAPAVIQRLILKGFHVESLDLGFNEEEINRKGVVGAGDIVYLIFRISGYGVKVGRAWIQADIRVQDDHRNIILDRTNVINSSLELGNRKSAKLVTRFALHPQAPPGDYEVTLVLRDMFSGAKVEEKRKLRVRP